MHHNYLFCCALLSSSLGEMAINLTNADQASHISLGLANMLNSSVLKDVTLACSEGQCLQAHRLILATFSPYFKQLLTVCKEPSPTILIPEIRVSVMEILLEFMYTGNICVKKNILDQLVEANRHIRITGLNDLLSKHVGISLPPKKKQRVEDSGASPQVKPSLLFRPWNSPVQMPRPENTFPWMYPMYGTLPVSSSIPFPNAYGNYFSHIIPYPMPAGSHVFSNTSPAYTSTLPYGNHSTTRNSKQSLPITASPLLTTASYFTTFAEQNKVGAEKPKATIITRKSKGKKACAATKGKYLEPGKERCDICNKAFSRLAHHKIVSHSLLKKHIECCGITFTTKHSFKTHRKSGCNFRMLHTRVSADL